MRTSIMEEMKKSLLPVFYGKSIKYANFGAWNFGSFIKHIFDATLGGKGGYYGYQL